MQLREIVIADLFCGGGGAAMGIHQAMNEAGLKHTIVGFDVKRMPRYPFCFVQQDAMTVDLSKFDAVWASPPCQGYSVMRNLPWNAGKEYPLLIAPTRLHLKASGLPYVIENVAGAKYGSKNLHKRGLKDHGMQAGFLCGGMFNLPFYRHRLFESSFYWMQPGHPKHMQRVPGPDTRDWNSYSFVFRTHANPVNSEWRETHDGTSRKGSLAAKQQGNSAQGNGVGVGHAKGWRIAAEAMGIDWMKRDELTQAIPPVFAKYIWGALIKQSNWELQLCS